MIEELISLFKKIKKINPDAKLSGSTALLIQGLNLRRSPNDIDVYLPYHSQDFIPLPGFNLKNNDFYYNDEPIQRKSYFYTFNNNEIKIDVFKPNSENQPKLDIYNSYQNELECVNYIEIIKFKIKHAFDLKSNSSNKHSLDLVYIFLNNTNLKFLTFGNVSQNLFSKTEQNITTSLDSFLDLCRPIIFLDTESTGTNKIKDRIIEISAIKIFPDGRRISVTERFNPQIPIPPEATAVHKITERDVAGKPKFFERASFFYDFFVDSDIGGYNIIEYDIPLLVEEFSRSNMMIPFNDQTSYIDSLKLYYQYQKRDLSSAFKFYCERPLIGAHAAEVDNLATIEILSKQIERHRLPKTVPELHKLCNEGKEILDYERKFTRNELGQIVFTFGKNKNCRACEHKDYLEWMLEQDFASYTKQIIKKIINGDLHDYDIDLFL